MAIADVVGWAGRVGIGSEQAEYDRCVEPSVDFDELALNSAQSGANCFIVDYFVVGQKGVRAI